MEDEGTQRVIFALLYNVEEGGKYLIINISVTVKVSK